MNKDEGQKIEVGKFTFEIPNGWGSEIDQGIFIIFDDKNGEGAIQISHFKTPSDSNINIFDEFYDFISETIVIVKNQYEYYDKIKQINNDQLSIELNLNDRFFIFSMFYYEHSILFVTYNCESQSSSKEKNIVEKFLKDITVSKES